MGFIVIVVIVVIIVIIVVVIVYSYSRVVVAQGHYSPKALPLEVFPSNAETTQVDLRFHLSQPWSQYVLRIV